MGLQLRRGTNVTRQSITPSEGELLYTTDTKRLFVGDGVTAGGNEVTSVQTGSANTLGYFAEDGAELTGTTKLTWNEDSKTLKVDTGFITVNSQNYGRDVYAAGAHYNSAAGVALAFYRSRGTATAPTILSTGDIAGNINFNMYTGLNYTIGAQIQSYATGTVTASGTALTAAFESKTGSGPYYVTFTIPTQGSAPALAKSYLVQGNENTNYNGSYICSASTTTSITLVYTNDPGVFGTNPTTVRTEAVIPTTVSINTTSTNGNLQKAVRISNTGQLNVGPTAADFAGSIVDPAWTGQLVLTSTQTFNTQPFGTAQVSLKSYANTTYSQSLNTVRYRGTVAAATALQQGDQLYSIKIQGYDGTTALTGAVISSTVDNVVSTGRLPTSLAFLTQNATSGTLTSALTIDSTQQVTVPGNFRRNGLELTATYYLDVASSAAYGLSVTRTQTILIVASGGLTATINMPPAPIDGQICRFTVSTNSVTLAEGTGTLVGSYAGLAPANTSFEYVYRASNTSWYRLG